jgi:glutaredoxin 3
VAKVEIYTKTFCGFCVRARHLLQSKGVDFDEYVIDGGGPKREEMIQRANGRTTVPQIFIDGRHVGGCNDLYDLERDGKLNELLAA